MAEARVETQDDVLRANLTVVRQRHESIIQALASVPIGERRVAVEQSRSGLPTLIVTERSATVHLHSAYDPIAEARRWVNGIEDSGWKIALVYGFALGYHVEELLRRFPDRQVVVVEADPLVMQAALTARDLRPLFSKKGLQVVAQSDPTRAAAQIFRHVSGNLAASLAVFGWPTSERLDRERWEEIETRVADLVRRQLVNVSTLRTFSLDWMVNFFSNLSRSIGDPGINNLREVFKNRPAILVSAGPSLDKNADLLSAAKGNALIVAAGSSLRPLLARGIEPDLVLSIDAGEANYRHFAELQASRVPLVYAPTLYPRILQEYRGPRWVTGMVGHPYMSSLFAAVGDDKGVLQSGPSVANAAWDLLRLMGSNPVIFVGQDLAYTENRTHARDAAHSRSIDLEKAPPGAYVYTEGVDGGQVLTDRVMYSMKLWFEERIGAMGDGRLFVDATEGGAKIQGTKIMTLRSALEEYCSERFDPGGTITRLHRQGLEQLEAKQVTERLPEALERIDRELQRVHDLYRSGAKVGRTLLEEARRGKVTPQRYQEAETRLRRIDRDLTRLKVFQSFVKPFVLYVIESVNSFLGTQVQYESDWSRRAEKLTGTYLTFFRAAHDTATRVRRMIAATQSTPTTE